MNELGEVNVGKKSSNQLKMGSTWEVRGLDESASSHN
jgi:hypothetical protein